MTAPRPSYKFADIIADSAIQERWEKVRRYFFLRESTYDMTSRCNIRCDGCYYYAGEKQFIHISVWGNDQTSLAVRKAPDMLVRQMDNYRGDPRAVFVYTFTPDNIIEAAEVTRRVADEGMKITFNMFSAPVGYAGNLRHSDESLRITRDTMEELLDAYPQSVLFSKYNIVAHTHQLGLHDLFSCSYPRKNPSTDIGLGRSFRQYRTNLEWDRQAACCVPDTDCDDCRHYAAGSAVVTARMYRHATDPDTFSSWLDYVDTYLAVWVRGYEKSPNLCDRFISPPLRA